jgi:hypothetical protein
MRQTARKQSARRVFPLWRMERAIAEPSAARLLPKTIKCKLMYSLVLSLTLYLPYLPSYHLRSCLHKSLTILRTATSEGMTYAAVRLDRHF